MNAVDICNLALGRIGEGASSPIQSIDPNVDDSQAARACARSFAPAMRAVLREHAWNWAQSFVALSLSAETVPGFGFVYAYPSGCLRLHGIMPVDWPPGRACPHPWPYRLFAASTGESTLIATDLQDACAYFTRDIQNPAFGDALFHDALAWRLAKELALGLKANPNFATLAEQEYQIALSKADATNNNEGVVEPGTMAADTQAYYGMPGGLAAYYGPVG